jgi:hypothetical protein
MSMGKTVNSRIRQARRAVPELIRQALRIHAGSPRQLQVFAVLSAWAALAGAAGWTPKMVEFVELKMKEEA